MTLSKTEDLHLWPFHGFLSASSDSSEVMFFHFLICFFDIPNLKGTFVTAFFFTPNLAPKCFYFLQGRYFFNFYWLLPYFSVKYFCILLKDHIMTIKLVTLLIYSNTLCSYLNLLFEFFLNLLFLFER